VKRNRGEGVLLLRCGDAMEPLQGHPSCDHTGVGKENRAILTDGAADLVCTPLNMPTGNECVCAMDGVAADGGGRVVQTVWFRPEQDDEECVLAHGTLDEALNQIRRCMSGQTDNQGGGGGGVQVADGRYLELGVGVMSGRGRHSVNVAGHEPSAHVFSRHPVLSDTMERSLSVVVQAVGELTDRCWGGALRAAAAERQVRESCEVAALRQAYQYPRQQLIGHTRWR
jgi:hypothetical protein